MSNRSQTISVARREFRERARSKVFIITMIVLALLVIGGMFLIGLLAGGEDTTYLGVGGDSPEGIVQDIEATAAALDVEVEVTEYGSAEAAVQAVEDGDVEAALVDGDTIVVNRGVSRSTELILTTAASAAARREVAADLGLTAEDVAQVIAPVEVTVTELDPEDPEEDARRVLSFLTAIVLLTTIMMFGQFVAMGIVEEKQNRVVEVVLARIQTTSLLIGKVLGIGALGIVQIASIGVAVTVGLLIAPLPDELGIPNLASIGISAVLWLGFWFVLGYLVYSFLYAAMGATISRQEDLQSVAFIPAMGILPAYFLVAVAVGQPEPTPLVKFASYIPLWSPILMPFRINLGVVAPWEVALAIALAIATIAALVVVSARIYRGAALRTGARISLKDAWSSASK